MLKILLSLLILLLSAGFAQVMESNISLSNNEKVYINQWLETPLTVDKFGVPSSQKRKIKLILTGPKNVFKAKKSSFKLRILTENWDQTSSSPNSAYFIDLKLFLVTTDGFVEFIDNPRYTVFAKNSLTREEVRDIPAAYRKFYTYLGNASLAFFKAIPFLGGILDISKNFKLTYDYLRSDEKNWLYLWQIKNEYDIYPLLMPIHSNPASFYRVMEIDIPFKKIKESGQLLLVVESIGVKSFNNDNVSSVFKNLSFELLMENYPESLFNMIQPQGSLLSEKSALLDNNPSLADIKVEYQLINGIDGNLLRLNIKPESKKNLSIRLENISCAIEVEKEKLSISALPTYFNFAGRPVSWQTDKDRLGSALFIQWSKFGSGLISKTIGSVISLFSGIDEVFYSRSLAQKSVSFSSSIKKVWQSEREYNYFPLPPISNYSSKQSTGMQGVRLDIPVNIYSFDLPKINLHVLGNARISNNSTYNGYQKFSKNLILDLNKKPDEKESDIQPTIQDCTKGSSNKKIDFYNTTYLGLFFGFNDLPKNFPNEFNVINGKWYFRDNNNYYGRISIVEVIAVSSSNLNCKSYFIIVREYYKNISHYLVCPVKIKSNSFQEKINLSEKIYSDVRPVFNTSKQSFTITRFNKTNIYYYNDYCEKEWMKNVYIYK